MKSLADAKIYSLVRATPGGRMVIRIECTDCSATADHPGSKVKPPAAAKFFRQKNWEVDTNGRSAKCPRCNHMKAKSSDMKSVSPDARKMQRAAYRLLEENFDEDTGCYAPGWSDAEIAKHCKLSESAVADLRNDAFGELTVDPALEAILDRVGEVETRWLTEKGELAEMIKTLDKETGQQLAALKVDLMAITKGHRPAGAVT